MDGVTITHAELLDALLAATTGDGPEHARTAQELALEAGISVPRIRQALQRMAVAGRLRTHRVRRTDLSGRSQVVPAYTVVPSA